MLKDGAFIIKNTVNFQGVRIVEFESNDLELNGKNMDAEVELWDCSGDKQ